MRKPISIYIHIPFCIKKCNYCDFLSAPADGRTQEEYLHALEGEIQRQAEYYRDYAVRTVYIGGGTPTAVPYEKLCHMLQVLFASFHVEKGMVLPTEASKEASVEASKGASADASKETPTEALKETPVEALRETSVEVSMEANPGTVDEESLLAYKAAGINRLSMGLQSARDEELALLGRIHNYADFLESYEMAVAAGFRNINVDLMSALPGQKAADYADTVKKVLALTPGPCHISAYSLIIEEGTLFYEKYGTEWERMTHTGEAQAHLPSEEEEREMYRLTENMLAGAGYHRYEISNYSLPGYECAHNKVYWQRGDYAGFGLGAASMVGNVRFRNTSDLQAYIREKDKMTERIQLTVKEQMEEFMFLGLRLAEGVERKAFQESFGVSLERVYGEIIRENVEKGLLTDGDRIALTAKGTDLGNYVSAQFLQ